MSDEPESEFMNVFDLLADILTKITASGDSPEFTDHQRRAAKLGRDISFRILQDVNRPECLDPKVHAATMQAVCLGLSTGLATLGWIATSLDKDAPDWSDHRKKLFKEISHHAESICHDLLKVTKQILADAEKHGDLFKAPLSSMSKARH